MRKFRNLVIGGIQSKVFNLILFTILLLSAAFTAVYLYHSNMLTQLVTDASRQQEESIRGITGQVMDAVVKQSLERSNRTDADIADAMFDSAAQRVRFVGERAAQLLAHPEDYPQAAWSGPRAEDDGTWTAKVILADGTDARDPALTVKAGLLANLSESMISLCRTMNASTMYLGLPEGAHLSVSDRSSSWFTEEGRIKSYDPRQRGWYQKAAAEGKLVFTDGEWDANTGAYCIECAMPVYGPDGSLQAVVGTDMFLTEMERVMTGLSAEGEHFLLLNQNGVPVLAPQAESFPMSETDRTGDVRNSAHAGLARAAAGALRGETVGVEVAALADGNYYLTAAPIPSTGWVLLTAFEERLSAQPIVLLQDSQSRIQQEAAAVYAQKNRQSRITSAILGLIVVALALTGALVLGFRIVRPLNRITRRISEIHGENLEFKMEDDYRTGDEVEELARSFADLSHKTLEYVDTVKRVSAEKERIRNELTLANQIQAAMLPHLIPAFPGRTDFDILASMDPAKEVGGDFYDYSLVDDDHLYMVIADVSGKGVPAALFMMASKIILQSIAMMGKHPAEILKKTNEAVCSNNDETQMFVTVWLGILELSTGRLVCANAGHEYPVFKRTGEPFELYKDKHGLVIGAMEGLNYREYEIQMKPGDKLFVYTDGVPEAGNSRKELFGTDRMMEALNREPEAPLTEVLQNVRRAVDAFVGDAEQADDLTMLCLEYKGPQSRA